jgi:hypothetical protein
MLDRSGCSLEECPQGGAGSTGRSEMLLQELMHRRKLLRNLLQTRLIQAVPAPATLKQSQTTGKAKPKKTIKKQNHCFNLPHRYFYFVPLIPSNWMDYEEDNDDEGNNSHNQGGRRIQDQQYLDPPPVLFECDCFCMTSSGTSSEMILQDPFDGSVRVYPSIITDLQQETPMFQSDSSSSSLLWTAMEEEQDFVQAVWTTTTMKLPMTGPAASVSRVVEWSTTTPIALDPSQTAPPPPQCLCSAEDFMTLNLSDYFPHIPTTERRDDDDEFDLSPVGVDAKTIFSHHHHEPVGTMIVVGKTLHNFASSSRRGGTEESVCTEFVAWFRWNHNSNHSNGNNNANLFFGAKSICRFPWSFHHVDMDAQRARCVVSFYPGEGPFGNASTTQLGGALADPNANPVPANSFRSSMNSSGRSQLAIYPLIPIESEASDLSPPDVHSYFPNPTLTIHCSAPITTFALDSVTGTTLLVATSRGTMEVWKVEEQSSTRTKLWNIQQRLQQRIEQNAKLSAPSASPHHNPNLNDDVVMTDGWNHTMEQNLSAPPSYSTATTPQNTTSRSLALWQVVLDATRLVASHPVESIFVARHLSIATCGFVTLQHGGDGCNLCWWRNEQQTTTTTTTTASLGHSSSHSPDQKEEEDYQVAAWINLPLSPRRVPRVFFDGTRLIVLGQDHIGIIILIYHVLSTASSLEEVHLFQESASVDSSSSSSPSSPSGGPEGDDPHGDDIVVAGSGGVYNLSIDATTGKRIPRVRLANRIRHVALGGLSSMDSIHMTCNERFLIVNTKTGHLLPTTAGGSDGSGAADGLLVIDLLDKTKQERDG